MREGPVLIAYDGSAAADKAVREAGELLSGRAALVLTVWKPDLGLEVVQTPAASLILQPATLDIGAALEANRNLAEHAQRLAQHGAGLAREAGFDAEGLAVADESGRSVADTIVRAAGERDAQAVVVGAHGKGRVGELLLGSTSREVVRRAEWPVVVVRDPEDRSVI
jgi:nucleotide-binding universal stress UspA family protein